MAVLELGKLHRVGVEAGSTQLRRFHFLSDTVCRDTPCVVWRLVGLRRVSLGLGAND